jgi:hypothetical protein
MRYRRSGAGPTVILLGADTGPVPLSGDLIAALTERFRVIVPEVPAGADVLTWLADFLEALGTSDLTIVAANHLCMPAIELAFRDSDQIRRMVLIPDGEPDDSTAEGALRTSLGTGLVPLLIVRPGLSAEASIPIVTTFIAGA